MKKLVIKKLKNLKNLKIRQVDIHTLSERTLLLNLYITQGLTLFIGILLLFFQHQNPLDLFGPNISQAVLWGTLLSISVLSADLSVSNFVPEEVTDDGGVNDALFRNRPLWHIVVICLIVSMCEEILFRGGVMGAIGNYWTSIVFAGIHVRYLRHWLMTGLVFCISYGLGWIYLRTGTILSPMVAHFLIDLIMGCIIKYRRET